MTFGLVALLAGEIGARLDDRVFDGVPFLDNPYYEALFYRDEHRLRHGRPGAQWKKVRLNNLGMRGEDVSLEPRAGCRRVMFLGASETFGEPSVAANEFPARVAKLAGSRDACVEVLNTSFPGIAPQSLNAYYVAMLQQFRPDTVYVYLSTHFYLAERLPRKPEEPIPSIAFAPEKLPPPEDTRSWLDKSRLLERLRESAETPAVIQQFIDRTRVEELLAGEPDPTLFPAAPPDRLDYIAVDLKKLLASIRASGAVPVLMTHAVRVNNPPREEDKRDLFAMRAYVPRAPEDVLAEFEYAGAERVREVAKETDTRLIDVAAGLSGKRELFLDLVHFNPKGHEAVSRLIFDDLQSHGS